MLLGHAPGDPAVGDAIRGLAGRYSSVLLSNHEPVIAGDTPEGYHTDVEQRPHVRIMQAKVRHVRDTGRDPVDPGDGGRG